MPNLFAPGTIGHLSLKNRIVRSAFMENMASPGGLPTSDTLRLYERLARGGVGLIITGMAYVNCNTKLLKPPGKSNRQHPVCLL